jgi:hypothetical protein
MIFVCHGEVCPLYIFVYFYCILYTNIGLFQLCSKAILTYNNLTATAQQLSFLSEGTYYAYVKAVDGNGNEVAESKYFEFDIKAVSLVSLGYVVGAGSNNLNTSHWSEDKLKGVEFFSPVMHQSMYKFSDGYAFLFNGAILGYSSNYASALGWTN